MRLCPTCKSEQAFHEIVRGKIGIDREPLTIARCECGTLYQAKSYEPLTLAKHYEYMGHTEAAYQMTPLLEARLRRTTKRLGRPPRHRARLLEVGCGGGLFAQVASGAGWEVYGTEISASCVALLSTTMGERLHHGDISTAPWSSEWFDAVVMIEVLEHLDEPLEYLKTAHRLLKPGGKLFLTTPNIAGITGRLLGFKWRVYGDEHLNYFVPRALTRLLGAAGFVIDDLYTTNLDVSSLRTAMHSSAEKVTHKASAPAAPNHSKRKTMLIDVAMEAINVVVNTLRIGDSLKVIAHR